MNDRQMAESGGALLETLRELTPIWGPPGGEVRVTEAVAGVVGRLASSARRDALGNLIVRSDSGARSRVALFAHLDQPGLIVTHVEDNGLARVAPVGDVPVERWLHQRVVFENGARGVVAAEPGPTKELEWHKVYLDVGAAQSKPGGAGIAIGDVAVAVTELTHWPGEQGLGRVSSASLDGRLGAAILVELARRLGRHAAVDLAFTAQELVGGRGAKVAAYDLAPDLAVVIDASPAEDTGKDKLALRLGHGPVLRLRERGFVSHPSARQAVERAAEAAGVKLQIEVSGERTSDAGPIQATRGGVPTAVLAVPVRHLHAAVEVADLSDALAALHVLLTLVGARAEP